ncbi:protein-disulfide reductase DsbD domain-containing protein [Pseudaminobacter salicylatoxidans]|uniref:protein-disulfide reductase DsbD domain-containing protein n=1 Tax=Pseudaminobacter salicylatoxidans TaxID=93369 RepID=UPI0002EE5968|nr:protein-disulfide reductase DsbD domain-containing protein [Pseudaminobacter salicylatoxidans]
MKTLSASTLACLVIFNAGHALAASSKWVEAQGGKVRLVTTGKPDAQGRLEGILDIHLDEGWKTYWRDPGDAGVPPSLEVSASTNVTSAQLRFPAPQRHDDGYAIWAGYNHSVALPVIFHVAKPDEPAKISADVFLGICESICIPVSAKLTLDPAENADDSADAAAVTTATRALPLPASPDFDVALVSDDTKTALLDAKLPSGASSADLFIAGGDGYVFATPRKIEKDGKTQFSVEILDRPAAKPVGGGLHYTLVTDKGAVSGMLPYL